MVSTTILSCGRGLALTLLVILGSFHTAWAQDPGREAPTVQAQIGLKGNALVDTPISFDVSSSTIPEEVSVDEVLWDFGDGVRTTGNTAIHSYTNPGRYQIKLTIASSVGQSEDTAELRVFDHALILIADATAPDNQLELASQQAAEEGVLLITIKAKTSGPEALVEEELTQLLLNAREKVAAANLIVSWTSASIGPTVLSRFAQQVKQSDDAGLTSLDLATKGVLILSDTRFGVLAPTAQSMFDQLRPAYVALTRPDALQLLLTPISAEETRTIIISSPLEYRLLGAFSSRTINQLGITNFMSFGINYLINGGVPISNIILVLLIPVIATILSFARQIIGLKAFGLITPAMTTLSFLVLGLQAGLIVFVVVVLSGSVTRLLLKKLQLLYLPRMALVLTTSSLAILVMLGVGVAINSTAQLSFTIFPILILIILAEELVAVQFSRGARAALRLTAWTLLLATVSYGIVSWQLLRTALLAYPELILLAIPINIGLGRFSGLRLVEYLRFRDLLRRTRASASVIDQ